jgi:hypothetical protein
VFYADQTITPGSVPGTREERILDWAVRERHDSIFGDVLGKSKRAKVESLEQEYLKKNWTPDTVDHGVVLSHVESDTKKSGTTWTAIQVRAIIILNICLMSEKTWGFEEVEEERRHTRHIHFTGPDGKIIEARLVYDYRELQLFYGGRDTQVTSMQLVPLQSRWREICSQYTVIYGHIRRMNVYILCLTQKRVTSVVILQ